MMIMMINGYNIKMDLWETGCGKVNCI